jgi:hypothetical protein
MRGEVGAGRPHLGNIGYCTLAVTDAVPVSVNVQVLLF